MKKYLLSIIILTISPILYAEEPSVNSPLKAYVGRQNINMHSAPSESSDIIAEIPDSEQLSVLEKSTHPEAEMGKGPTYYWYQVKYSSNTGWVRADLIATNEMILQTPNKHIEIWSSIVKSKWLEMYGDSKIAFYWLINKGYDKASFLFEENLYEEQGTSWSPDGKHLTVYNKIFNTDGKEFIFKNLQAISSTWSNDSKYLYFVTGDECNLAENILRVNLKEMKVEVIVENPYPITEEDRQKAFERTADLYPPPAPIKWSKDNKSFEAAYDRIIDGKLTRITVTYSSKGKRIKESRNLIPD